MGCTSLWGFWSSTLLSSRVLLSQILWRIQPRPEHAEKTSQDLEVTFWIPLIPLGLCRLFRKCGLYSRAVLIYKVYLCHHQRTEWNLQQNWWWRISSLPPSTAHAHDQVKKLVQWLDRSQPSFDLTCWRFIRKAKWPSPPSLWFVLCSGNTIGPICTTPDRETFYIEVATPQKRWEDGMVNKFAGLKSWCWLKFKERFSFLKGRGNSTIRGSGYSWEFQKSIPKKVSIIAGVVLSLVLCTAGSTIFCLFASLLPLPFLYFLLRWLISSVAGCLMLLSVPFRRKLPPVSIDTPATHPTGGGEESCCWCYHCRSIITLAGKNEAAYP